MIDLMALNNYSEWFIGEGLNRTLTLESIVLYAAVKRKVFSSLLIKLTPKPPTIIELHAITSRRDTVSNLSIEDAAATTLLSKRWNDLRPLIGCS